MDLIFLNFRRRPRGGGVRRPPDVAELKRSLQANHEVIVLVHGYNVDQVGGLERIEGFKGYLRTELPVLGVLWPGDSIAGGISYSFQGPDADATAHEMAVLFGDIWPQGATLHFVSHSLGARVVLRTIERMAKSKFTIGNVCLMAPALDNNQLSLHPSFYDAASLGRRISVLYSTQDKVLGLPYRAGDFFQAFFYGERAGAALGRTGPIPRDIPATLLACEISAKAGHGHGDYMLPRDDDDSRPRRCADFVDQALKGNVLPVEIP